MQASAMPAGELITIDWNDREIAIEYRRVACAVAQSPLLVFLHEGLGSVALWQDFPDRLCAALGLPGLVYSRPGYGRSTPRAADEHWHPDFMHRQAHEVLPAVLDALQLDCPIWLLGHSDGASIALLYAAARNAAASRGRPDLLGVIAMAPHIFVETCTVERIRDAREAYLSGDLRRRLARYHDDVDSAFFGWNDIWLDPRFAAWRIDEELAMIACPVLAIQGVGDEYGSMQQIRGIAERVAHTRLLELADCGHSPHRDAPQAVIDATTDIINKSLRASGQPSHRSAPVQR